MGRAGLDEPLGAGLCGSASGLALPLVLSAFRGEHEISGLANLRDRLDPESVLPVISNDGHYRGLFRIHDIVQAGI